MEPIVIILLCVLAFVAAIHLLSSRHASRPRTIKARAGATRQADPLVAACLGDRAKADRLVLYEKKNPLITDAEARKRALERLTSDRS